MKSWQFKDAEFMSAQEKELVLEDWVRFLKALLEDDGKTEIDRHGNEMPKLFKAFRKRLYEHLHLHYGFIAHYDRWGFFQTYFADGDGTIEFLSRFENNAKSCCEDYDDLNAAMVEEATPLIPKIVERAEVKQQNEDLATASALLAKHGLQLKI